MSDEKPVTVMDKFNKLHPWTVTVVAVIVFLAANIGGYMTNRVVSDMKIDQINEEIKNIDVFKDQQEKFGHPDHEKRITRLEARADNTDKDMYELKRNVDVAIALLKRIDDKLQHP